MTNRERRRPDSAEKTVRDIRRATRRKFSAEEKIGIVLEGFRGEERIAKPCRTEDIAQKLSYRWSRDFREKGKTCLAVHVGREASSDEVEGLHAEARQLNEALAEVTLEIRLLETNVLTDGENIDDSLGFRRLTGRQGFTFSFCASAQADCGRPQREQADRKANCTVNIGIARLVPHHVFCCHDHCRLPCIGNVGAVWERPGTEGHRRRP